MEKQGQRDLTAAKIGVLLVSFSLIFCLAAVIVKNVFGLGWEVAAPLVAVQTFCMGLYIGWWPLRVLRDHRKGGE